MSRETRLTRAEKIALSALGIRYQTAKELDVSASALDRLNERGLCDFSLDLATPTYRINEAGAAKRKAFAPADGEVAS